MKAILGVVFIFLFAVTTVSCSTESVDDFLIENNTGTVDSNSNGVTDENNVDEESDEPDSTEVEKLNIPVWLRGEYQGVHTQQPLYITESTISFSFLEQSFSFSSEDVLIQFEEEDSYHFYTDSVSLIFYKTTLETEINFRFNDLNLGWYRVIEE